MIAALAEAGRSLGRPDWIEAAAKAFAHISSASRDNRLPHSMLGASKLFPALSIDYAAMANAAISLFEASGDWNYIDQAKQFIEQLDHWHADAAGTGYYLTASDSTDVPIRIRGDVDEAISSATSQIIAALVRLASVTGDLDLQEKAWKVAEHAAGRAAHQAYGQAGIVNACALAIEPLKLVVIDDLANPKLVPVANRSPDPRRVDIVVAIGSETNRPLLPGGILPPTDRPGAWLCTGQVCLPVVTDAGSWRSCCGEASFVILWRSKERSDAAQTMRIHAATSKRRNSASSARRSAPTTSDPRVKPEDDEEVAPGRANYVIHRIEEIAVGLGAA